MDPSTEKLLERTRQRREQLNEALGVTTDLGLRSEGVKNFQETVNAELEADFDADFHSENTVKSPEKSVTPEKHRKARFYTAFHLEENVKCQESVAPEARKARFAALAAQIESYEDDLSHHAVVTHANEVSTKRNETHPTVTNVVMEQDHQKDDVSKNVHFSPETSPSDDGTSPKNSSGFGVESFFVRKPSLKEEIAPKQHFSEPKQQFSQPKQQFSDAKSQSPEPKKHSPDRKQAKLETPTFSKQDVDHRGKVFAMANKWESQIKTDVKSGKETKPTAPPAMKTAARPVPPAPAPPSAAFKETKEKIASNLNYSSRCIPKRDNEPKDVNKLRNRWEIATQRGIALQPEQSLSQYDVLTATAIKMFQPKGISHFIKKDAQPMQNIAKPLAPPRANAQEAKEVKTLRSELEVRVSPCSPPVVVENKENTTLPTITVEKIYPKIENSYDGDTSNSSEFVDSAELDACLDEAINSATLAALRSPRTPVDTKPPSLPDTGKLSSTPLVYTVSMYRRMLKEQSADSTPVKAVVKPPSSPHRSKPTDVIQNLEKYAGVYEKRVKALNDAVTVQQEQIYQASRALSYCRNNEEFRGSTEEVDAHKVLLVAGERRKALQQELERIFECRRLRKPLDSDDPLGTLTFQYIGLSLKREFVNDRINSMVVPIFLAQLLVHQAVHYMPIRGDYVYFFICILKYRDQILTTQFVDSDVAIRAGGRVEFPNYFQFKSLPHDFNVEVSVFSLQTKREELSHEQKYHLKGNTLKRKQRPNSVQMPSSVTSLGGPGGVLDSNFRLVGQVNLSLSSVTRQKFALQGFQCVAPLEAGIHLKMRCTADSMGIVEEKGFLSVYEEITHLGCWNRWWCTLKDGVMRFWRFPDEEQTKEPVLTLDLYHCVTKYIEVVPKEICTRLNTFVLDINHENTSELTRHLLSADNKEECLGWCEKLNQALRNVRIWNTDAIVL